MQCERQPLHFREHRWNFKLLASAQHRPGCGDHLGSDPEEDLALFLSELNILSTSWFTPMIVLLAVRAQQVKVKSQELGLLHE